MNLVGELAPTALPSPPHGIWYLGPVPVRAYGILMVTAMAVAVWLTGLRYRARGGDRDLMWDVAVWAIPLGIVGARLYHVATSPQGYFGPDGDPVRILEVWNGGLGIWGAVVLGALGAYIAVRRAGQRLGPLADAVAPALLVAQAIGRWGNYFNQELFGRPTTLPWGLSVDVAHTPAGYPVGTLFHPTFLYESLWDLAMAGVLVVLDRRVRVRAGQLFGAYAMLYACGRVWIESLRIDPAQMVGGLRLNVWTSIGVFVLGAAIVVACGLRGRPTRVTPAERAARIPAAAGGQGTHRAESPERIE